MPKAKIKSAQIARGASKAQQQSDKLYSQEVIKTKLVSLYRNTSKSKYANSEKNPGMPLINVPNNRQPSQAEFNAASRDMLHKLTPRQLETVMMRVAGRNGVSDEKIAKKTGVSKKRVRELEKKVFFPDKITSPAIRRCLAANLISSRIGYSHPAIPNNTARA